MSYADRTEELSDRAHRIVSEHPPLGTILERAASAFESGRVEYAYVLFTAAIGIIADGPHPERRTFQHPLFGAVMTGSLLADYVIARSYGISPERSDGGSIFEYDSIPGHVRSIPDRALRDRALSWIVLAGSDSFKRR